ncbi:putative DNA-binding protein [Streptococcus pneumoniae]|nr:putative DNA-binding protein [Streptococcus pneumoniae]CIY20233.1 putative DNA-binding protein [Streptococcus pneumoniae]CJB00361.1 putative DNA-binding protein [Streptococcus pneumoniae]CJB72922.1 putative DNA-binding protein [Streptococcus pneumoniae]CJM79991.1 putative DNA-binding protein [Streptococcus pneumoniae]
MEHLGKVFREFRTSGNYSLKEAAGESCSTSQLSRFELGESDLAVSRFFEILDNIHVTIENFMDKARNFHTILQVFKSFKENNLKSLRVRRLPFILS